MREFFKSENSQPTDITCPDPPAKPAGGRIEWDGSNNYDTEVSYNCGPHAAFYPDLSERKGGKCLWDTTWGDLQVPLCQVLRCPTIPEPPEGSGLVYKRRGDEEYEIQTSKFN